MLSIPLHKQHTGHLKGNAVLWQWTVFAIYILLLTYVSAHHELWGDEFHSWNIAKGSTSYANLIANTRYEGHPPAWFTLLWIISKFTHHVAGMQIAEGLLSCAVVFLILFLSPFPLRIRLLIPFGYFFLFEYAVLNRNYMIGVFFAFCVCLALRKNTRPLVYYILLFCLSNTHLLALILAGSLHLYYLLTQLQQHKRYTTILLHVLLGAIVLLPAVYFIYPPSDSETNIHSLVEKFNPHQLTSLGWVPLRVFIPLPAWWETNFWNTQFLVDMQSRHALLKTVNFLLSAFLILMAVLVLKEEKKSLTLFLTNLLLSAILHVSIFSLSTVRYTGFIYIGFLVAYWLYCYEKPTSRLNRISITSLLIVQMAAGIFAVSQDISRPFSNSTQLYDIMGEVPPGEKWVTDYWTMNTITGMTGQPAYCVDMQKDISFILWASDLAQMRKNPNRYSKGLNELFQQKGMSSIYMISHAPLTELYKTDSLLSTDYRTQLVDQRVGAIEKGSNLYLYKITPL